MKQKFLKCSSVSTEPALARFARKLNVSLRSPETSSSVLEWLIPASEAGRRMNVLELELCKVSVPHKVVLLNARVA